MAVSNLASYFPSAQSDKLFATGVSKSPLSFRKVTLEDLPAINDILRMSGSLTCDYTVGGIFMWIDYFNYEFCIYEDTLFISGVEENHLDRVAFSCPIGKLPLPKSIALLKEYCDERDMPLYFSAIPADRLACFTVFSPGCRVEELTDWSDYVYEVEKFSTLSGKKMAKKRNHVNRFLSEHPDYVLESLNKTNSAEALAAMTHWAALSACNTENVSVTKSQESREVSHILQNIDQYPFEGVVLRTSSSGSIVAFSLAEIINDTAYVHIEKMDHSVPGAGETVAHLFMARLCGKYTSLRFLNREEDCGDEGLRHAKESWHPAMLLKKYNVEI